MWFSLFPVSLLWYSKFCSPPPPTSFLWFFFFFFWQSFFSFLPQPQLSISVIFLNNPHCGNFIYKPHRWLPYSHLCCLINLPDHKSVIILNSFAVNPAKASILSRLMRTFKEKLVFKQKLIEIRSELMGNHGYKLGISILTSKKNISIKFAIMP